MKRIVYIALAAIFIGCYSAQDEPKSEYLYKVGDVVYVNDKPFVIEHRLNGQYGVKEITRGSRFWINQDQVHKEPDYLRE